MLACFCLNIMIETGPSDFLKVTAETLGLNETEISDNFFKQDIQQVGKLINITKVHSGLVQSRHIGSWIVTRCINCDCNTHAVHREKGASCVLIYTKLLNSEAILSLKASEIFSTIFNIVVNPNEIGAGQDILDTYLPSELESDIKNIKLVMTEFLRKETLAMKERIKKYTEEQYEELNNLKDRAFKEQESLSRVIRSTIDQTKLQSTKGNMAVAAGSQSRPDRLNDQMSTSNVDKPILSSRHTPKRQKGSPGVRTSSLDVEGLFDFEGSDGASSLSASDLDDSDKEDAREEAISIQKSRPLRGSIAKSLPMNIPAFMQDRPHFPDDLDDVQDDNVDIAASIKALARSVHGDAVFGDLPRPRFSTQI